MKTKWTAIPLKECTYIYTQAFQIHWQSMGNTVEYKYVLEKMAVQCEISATYVTASIVQ